MSRTWARAPSLLSVDAHLHEKAPIWRNANIRIGGELLNQGPWCKTGIRTLSHLIFRGELKSFAMLQDEFVSPSASSGGIYNCAIVLHMDWVLNHELSPLLQCSLISTPGVSLKV